MVEQKGSVHIPKPRLLELQFGLASKLPIENSIKQVEGKPGQQARHEAAVEIPVSSMARLSPDIQDFLTTFSRNMELAVSRKDLSEIVRVWETVVREVKRRKDNNDALYNPEEHSQTQPNKTEILEELFAQKATEIFGQVDQIKGKAMVTTLRGFFFWKIGRFFQAFLNKHDTKDGKRKFGFDLQDDDIQITAEGITVYNPDAGVNRRLTEWSTIAQKWDIVLDCSWAFDWLNWLRSFSWNKETANNPVYPYGILRIEEAGGDQIFAEVMLRNPNKWADAIQALKKTMTDDNNFPPVEKPTYLAEFSLINALERLKPEVQEKIRQIVDAALEDPIYAEQEMPTPHQVFLGKTPISEKQWLWLKDRRDKRAARRQQPLINRLLHDLDRWSAQAKK